MNVYVWYEKKTRIKSIIAKLYQEGCIMMDNLSKINVYSCLTLCQNYDSLIVHYEKKK